MHVLVSALQASISLVAHCLKTGCLSLWFAGVTPRFGSTHFVNFIVVYQLCVGVELVLVLFAFCFSPSLFHLFSLHQQKVACCAWTDTSVFDALLPRLSAPEVLVAATELSPFCKHFRWPRSFPGFKTQTPLLLIFQVRFFGVLQLPSQMSARGQQNSQYLKVMFKEKQLYFTRCGCIF